jgi:hypothetical protein
MAITPQRRSTVIHGHYTTEEVNSNTWPLNPCITVDLLCDVMAMYYG